MHRHIWCASQLDIWMPASQPASQRSHNTEWYIITLEPLIIFLSQGCFHCLFVSVDFCFVWKTAYMQKFLASLPSTASKIIWNSRKNWSFGAATATDASAATIWIGKVEEVKMIWPCTAKDHSHHFRLHPNHWMVCFFWIFFVISCQFFLISFSLMRVLQQSWRLSFSYSCLRHVVHYRWHSARNEFLAYTYVWCIYFGIIQPKFQRCCEYSNHVVKKYLVILCWFFCKRFFSAVIVVVVCHYEIFTGIGWAKVFGTTAN